MIRSRGRLLLAAAGVGLVLGAFSFLGDGRLGGRAFDLLGNLAAPWVLVAFVVGRLATSARRGALAGATALILGVVTYYALGASAGYFQSAGNLVWVVIAVVIGPSIGLCGAAVTSDRPRTAVTAAVAPAALLLAEATYVAFDRGAWTWDFQRQPYRLIDLAVVLGLVAIAAVLPAMLLRGRRLLRVVYPAVLAASLVGAVGFALLYGLLSGIANLG